MVIMWSECDAVLRVCVHVSLLCLLQIKSMWKDTEYRLLMIQGMQRVNVSLDLDVTPKLSLMLHLTTR